MGEMGTPWPDLPERPESFSPELTPELMALVEEAAKMSGAFKAR